jgi:membrane protease subunit HflK
MEISFPPKFDKLPTGLIRTVLIVVLVLLMIPWLQLPFYMVPTDAAAVVKIFGKPLPVPAGPGIHFQIPIKGIMSVRIEPVERMLREEFGFRTVRAGSPDQPAEYEAHPEEAKMLVGDENIAYVEWTVQYKIADPIKYDINISNPQQTLRKASEAAMRKVVGESDLDTVITAGRAQIQGLAKTELQETLDRYEAGIVIVTVQLQQALAPDPVQPAFKEVVNAKEEKVTTINKAEEYRNQVVPEAQGRVKKMLQEAKAHKLARVAEAEGDASRFSAIAAEYEKAPDVTAVRLYYEMIQQVLPQLDAIYITNDTGEVVKYLPLEQLKRGEQ